MKRPRIPVRIQQCTKMSQRALVNQKFPEFSFSLKGTNLPPVEVIRTNWQPLCKNDIGGADPAKGILSDQICFPSEL